MHTNTESITISGPIEAIAKQLHEALKGVNVRASGGGAKAALNVTVNIVTNTSERLHCSCHCSAAKPPPTSPTER